MKKINISSISEWPHLDDIRMYDTYMLDLFYDKNEERGKVTSAVWSWGRRNKNKVKFPNESIIERYINERCPLLDKKYRSLTTVLYIVADELGITSGHHCQICGRLIIGFRNLHFERKFCSIECRNRSKEWSGNVHASAQTTYQSEEYKERMSKIGKEAWDRYSDEEKKDHLDRSMLGFWKSLRENDPEEYKKRHSRQGMKTSMHWKNATPEQKAKQSIVNRENSTRYWIEKKKDISFMIDYGNKVSESLSNRTPEQKKRQVLKRRKTMVTKNLKDYLSHSKSRNISNMETKTYEIVKMHFQDAVRWYSDNERYPWECDIYIPSKDAFIECQYFPAHGNRPWNGRDDDPEIEILKNKKLYNRKCAFIYYDPMKRKCAESHNLNYFEIWKYSDVYKTIDDICKLSDTCV